MCIKHAGNRNQTEALALALLLLGASQGLNNNGSQKCNIPTASGNNFFQPQQQQQPGGNTDGYSQQFAFIAAAASVSQQNGSLGQPGASNQLLNTPNIFPNLASNLSLGGNLQGTANPFSAGGGEIPGGGQLQQQGSSSSFGIGIAMFAGVSSGNQSQGAQPGQTNNGNPLNNFLQNLGSLFQNNQGQNNQAGQQNGNNMIMGFIMAFLAMFMGMFAQNSLASGQR